MNRAPMDKKNLWAKALSIILLFQQIIADPWDYRIGYKHLMVVNFNRQPFSTLFNLLRLENLK